METMKLLSRRTSGLGFILACILLAGCQSNKTSTTSSKDSQYAFDPLVGEMNANSGLPGSEASSAPYVSASDTNRNTAILQPGDSITVEFHDLVTPPTSITDQIKDDGSIVLYYNEKFHAANKSVRELQEEIRARYVPKYYTHMTPSVQTLERFFSVGGEVKGPNRYVWTPGMTVLSALTASGGFTDFSRRGRVLITRASTHKQEYVDCVKALKHPELDVLIYPGDQIFVRKRIW
jgi:protein involved in polysaccharide export with SLBB domain